MEKSELGVTPLTKEELEDVRRLPQYQPGCSQPDCHSCAGNRRREEALDHLLARMEHLESQRTKHSTTWDIWCESDDIGRKPAKKLFLDVVAPTFRDACRQMLGKNDGYDPIKNTWMGLRLYYHEPAETKPAEGPSTVSIKVKDVTVIYIRGGMDKIVLKLEGLTTVAPGLDYAADALVHVQKGHALKWLKLNGLDLLPTQIVGKEDPL